MNLSDKLFGSNVDPDVIEFFKQLQEGSFEVNPNQSINPTPYSNYLGDRIPFARMWTAVNIREMDLDEETQKLVLQEDKDSKNIIVVVNEHKNKNNYKELDSLDEQNSNLSNNVLKQVVPIYERNTNLTLTLKSTHPTPATLYSMTWEGDYTNKFYQRV